MYEQKHIHTRRYTMGEIIISNQNKMINTMSQDLLNSWLGFIDAMPKTIETYGKGLKQFFRYMKLEGIQNPTRQDILSYREYLKEDHKATTIQGYLASVKLFFKWTAQEGIYPNVADHIKGVKLDTDHKKDYLTSSQVSELLQSIDRDTLKGKRDYAILSLMVTTGLRTISVVRANVEDIRTIGGESALFYQGKGHEEKAEYVKLAPPVEKAIREYLQERGEIQKEAPLFASIANKNGGERLTTRSLSRIAKEHFISIGLNSERITAHSLRHTTATLNLLNGGSIEETQQLLGHKSINTTLIYAHALERAKNNSEARIASAIF